jgi:hypothetical protein
MLYWLRNASQSDSHEEERMRDIMMFCKKRVPKWYNDTCEENMTTSNCELEYRLLLWMKMLRLDINCSTYKRYTC